MKKKSLAILLCVAVLMAWCAVPALAAAPTPKVVIDGQTVTFDVPPMMDNGRTLVPLRAIFEKMGATVAWDEDSKTAIAVKGEITVMVKIGSNAPTINGVVKPIDVPAKIVDGRALAPMRFVCEAFGGTVSWDAEKYVASVVTTGDAGGYASLETGEATPEDMVDKYLSAFQKFDIEEMVIYEEISESADSEDDEDLTENDIRLFAVFFDYWAANAAKMSYTITGSEINGDIAVVTVDCQYIDGTLMIKESIKEAIIRITIEEMIDGKELSDGEATMILASAMREQMEKIDATYMQATIKINCIKEDNKWYVSSENDELIDMVTNNTISTFDEFVEVVKASTEATVMLSI